MRPSRPALPTVARHAARALALAGCLATGLHAQAIRPADREAERAQRDFERFRHQRLPTSYGGRAPCEERVGRFCYWSDGAGETPPESPGVPEARAALLDVLAGAQQRQPADPWVTGQRVRYLIESGGAAGALDAARACAADAWWCAALRGIALHAAERVAEADAAFDTAVALAPEGARCRLTNVAPWLEGDDRRRFERLPCPGSAERDSIAEALWRQADPFGGREASEARVVFLARRTMAMLLESAARADELRWGDDVEELGVRYGFATRWGKEQSGLSSDPWGSVVGHEPLHAVPFAPSGHAVARFPVAGTDTVLEMAPRAARFRRGDSLVVVVLYDASALERPGAEETRVRAAAALVHDEPGTDVRAVADRPAGIGRFALRVRNAAGTVYVDALDSASRRATRGHAAVAAMADSAGLSDLLLVRADRVRGRADVPLDSVLDAADGRAAVPSGEPLGLYWEAYRMPTEEDSLRVELRVVPTSISLAARFAAALRLRDLPQPQTIAWAAPPRPDAGEGHLLTVDTTGMPPGLYRLELWLRGRGPDAMAATDVRIAR